MPFVLLWIPQMKSTLFNENSVPAEEYAAGSESQGTAFVIQNTGAEDVRVKLLESIVLHASRQSAANGMAK